MHKKYVLKNYSVLFFTEIISEIRSFRLLPHRGCIHQTHIHNITWCVERKLFSNCNWKSDCMISQTSIVQYVASTQLHVSHCFSVAFNYNTLHCNLSLIYTCSYIWINLMMFQTGVGILVKGRDVYDYVEKAP